MDIPNGTLMSSLSRERQAFRGAVSHELKQARMPTTTHSREQQADPVLV